MADLTTVAQNLARFYRLVGSTSADAALVLQGEAVNAVAYEAFTQGTRLAQLWMLDQGYQGWRQRSAALSWTGTDATTGGKYSALPADFLRAYGNKTRSALVEANGDRWGVQIDADEDYLTGDLFYFRDDEIWLARDAAPPTTIYLAYHYMHPLWTASVTIDFPLTSRGLLAPYAAWVAADDNWLPGGEEMLAKIERAVKKAEVMARKLSRQTKEPRRFNKPVRIASHW